MKKAIVAGFACRWEPPALCRTTSLYLQAAAGLLGQIPGSHRGDYRGGRAARRSECWSPERLQIVAVGDLSKVEPTLKKLGAVQIFDAEGKPIEIDLVI
jgi:hypothetical protein